MVMTLSIWEINEFLQGKYKDPHAILGTHIVKRPDGPPFAVTRVFVPQAKSVTVTDPATGEEWPARRQHIEGFFEAETNRSEWFRCKLRFEGFGGEAWESYDPYSFAPQLSDADIHLIVEGTERFLYNKLGANVKTADGVPGVAFAVWAPGAESVSVVGSFNCWDERRGRMRLLNNSGVWELFWPGASAGDKYKFKIRRHGVFAEAPDPFGFSFEKRPGSAAIIADPGAFAWSDGKWMASRGNHRYTKGLSVCIGKWRGPDGFFPGYAEIARKLIKNALSNGLSHIILSPVMEYADDASLGYVTSGCFAPTSRFGPPEAFARLVDGCHRNGVAVILEWIPRFAPGDAHRLDVAESAALFWLKTYHVDGLLIEGGEDHAGYLKLITRLAAKYCPGAIIAGDGFVLTPFGR